MPIEISDLDRAYAQRAAQVSFEKRIVTASRTLNQGEVLRMYAPNYEEIDALAVVFATFREMYLGREKAEAVARKYAEDKRLQIETSVLVGTEEET